MLWRKIKYGRGIRNGEKGKKRNGEDLQLYSQAEPLSPKEGERGRSHVYLWEQRSRQSTAHAKALGQDQARSVGGTARRLCV